MILHHLFAAAANVLTLAFGLACFLAAHGIAQFWAQAGFALRVGREVTLC